MGPLFANARGGANVTTGPEGIFVDQFDDGVV